MKVFDLPELRDRVGVFRDRRDAGEVLADLLESLRGSEALVLAIPAGGYPVAAAIASRLGLSLEAAAVSKITPSWNTEVGYGAVAFDGTVKLDEAMMTRLGIGREELRRGIDVARRKVNRRTELLRGVRPAPDLSGRKAILVDDGLATGFTMLVGVEAVRRLGAEQVFVAVPTGHALASWRVAQHVQAVYCANLRAGEHFAVADAYQFWSDLTDEQILKIAGGKMMEGISP